ncbi:hypothetical protein MMC07_004461 [Pseudocyphellaria aurata]|nr:hypothetical protein [Pseudocyphellaria aurata]
MNTANVARKPSGTPKVVRFSARLEFIPNRSSSIGSESEDSTLQNSSNRSSSTGSESEDSTLQNSSFQDTYTRDSDQRPDSMSHQIPTSFLPALEQPSAFSGSEPEKSRISSLQGAPTQMQGTPTQMQCTSTPSYHRNPVAMPRRKPVPPRPALEQPVSMRVSDLPSPPKPATFSHFANIPEIQSAQDRIKKFVESEGYRQFMTDQHLVEDFFSTQISLPECRPSTDENLLTKVVFSPDIGSIGLESMMSNEELTVVRPKSCPSSLPPRHGLRRGTADLPRPPNVQKLSIRAELRNALPTGSSSRLAKILPSIPTATIESKGKSLEPEDWYPPRRYRPRQWKTAEQIVNRDIAATRGGSIGTLIEHTRNLIKTGTHHANIILGNARPPSR